MAESTVVKSKPHRAVFEEQPTSSSSENVHVNPDPSETNKTEKKDSTEQFQDKAYLKQQGLEMKRSKNYEEAMPWFCNLFFIFYFPYICRIKPLQEEDIPEIAERDKSQPNTDRLRKFWNPRCRAYLDKLTEYEEKMKTATEDEKKKLKKPTPPNLTAIALRAFLSLTMIIATLSLVLSTGFIVIEPTMTKYVLEASAKKAYYEYAIDGFLQQLPPEVDKEAARPQAIAYAKSLGLEDKFPYVYATILMCCPFMNALFECLGNRLFFHFAGSLRAALCGLIFDKTLLLNITAQSNLDSGRLLTLISTDARNIADMMPQFLMLVTIPFQFFVPLGFLIHDLGAMSLIALAVICVLMPIVIVLLRLVAFSVRDFLRLNDIRTKQTNETIEGIRVVKFSGLENLFVQRIENTRKEQMKYSARAVFLVHQVATITRNIPGIVNFSVIAMYVFGQDHDVEDYTLTMMPDIGYLTFMTASATILPVLLQALALMTVSFRRINEYLVLPEMEIVVRDEPTEPAASSSTEMSSAHAGHPITYQITNGAFEWDGSLKMPQSIGERQQARKDAEAAKEAASKEPSSSADAKDETVQSGTEMKEEEETFRLSDININLYEGTLTMVVGSVGSGKSSLGATVVGDIDQTAGEVRIKKGKIAYCAQNAWIINGTVKENIMLADDSEENPIPDGADMDAIRAQREERYQHTVHVCALEPDFQILAAGDMTAIGEKGVNLSGGQKARIQLARAVYADRDFYVLDDVLSAVDAHVGRFLFDNCITKELRDKGKTVMLMTNQLQFVDKADYVIVMDNGKIAAQGTPAEVKAQGIDFNKFIVNKEEAPKEQKSEPPKKTDEENSNSESGDEANPHPDAQPEHEETPANEDTQPAVPATQNAITPTPTPTGESPPASPSLSNSPQQTPTPTPTHTGEGKKMVGASILTEEEQETGGIPLKDNLGYVFTALPNWRFVLFFTLMVICTFCTSFLQYWLGVVGTDQFSDDFSFEAKVKFLIVIVCWGIFFFILAGIQMYWVEKRAGLTLHTRLINHVVNCPSSFFDTTPLGRTINRFTGDLTQADVFLTSLYHVVVHLWLGMVGQIVIVAVDNPIFIVVGVASIVVFWIMLQLYSRAARNFQRLESMARSPVLSVFGECLTGAGLTNIRIFQLQNRWRRKFNRLCDDWTARFVVFREGQRWATLYSAVISSCLLVSMVVIGWNDMEAAKMAVAISCGMIFGMLGVQIVQQNVELDARLTGLQRILHYSRGLPQEISSLEEIKQGHRLNIEITTDQQHPDAENEKEVHDQEQTQLAKRLFPEISIPSLPENWPATGTVEFDHVSYRYRPQLPFVLRGVSFSFRSGEKIGICGRTGAGKSSLIFPLFRLVELDPRLTPQRIDPESGFLEQVPCDPSLPDDNNTNRGRILLDGVDIATVNVHRLRRSMAIIPQDPTLFTGTLRSNLDLAGKCSDDEIWEVLELVSLKEVFEKELDKGLDTEVTEGGRNFSCGQRQLICFGRAMLQKTKVVLMDEATANVDVETDAKIQNTIRNVFKEQTVIVVAHRLNTIMGSDRILVMDKGQIAELDTPANLLANPNSAFNGLIRSLSG